MVKSRCRSYFLLGIAFALTLYLFWITGALRKTLEKPSHLVRYVTPKSSEVDENMVSRAGLHLILQFPIFNASSGLGEKGAKERQEEVIYCLQKNLLSPHVQEIHILFEGNHDDKFVKALDLNMNWKLVFFLLGRRMTYKDAFQYASLNLLGKTTMIMNSDNYVHAGFEYLDPNILSTKVIYALTRHEIPEAGHNCSYDNFCGPNAKYMGSHDAWVFRLQAPFPDKVLREIDYRPNINGIEQVLIFHLRTSGAFTIKNPCNILHIVHYHCSQITRLKNDRYMDGKRIDVLLGVAYATRGKLVMAPFSDL